MIKTCDNHHVQWRDCDALYKLLIAAFYDCFIIRSSCMKLPTNNTER
jgi:hypothetical protein